MGRVTEGVSTGSVSLNFEIDGSRVDLLGSVMIGPEKWPRPLFEPIRKTKLCSDSSDRRRLGGLVLLPLGNANVDASTEITGHLSDFRR